MNRTATLALTFLSLFLPLFLFTLLAPIPPAQAGDLNLFLGVKSLNEDDWTPLDSHTELGLQGSWGPPEWPVAIATDIYGSFDSQDLLGIDISASTAEINLGVRKIWRTGSQQRVRPYIGGGIASISGTFEAESGGVKVSDDGSGVGAWLGGGIFWRLGPSFNLGMDLRLSTATINLYGVERNAGGGHFGVIAGFGWPKSRA